MVFERKIKVCSNCGERDWISINESFCKQCLEEQKERNRLLLEI